MASAVDHRVRLAAGLSAAEVHAHTTGLRHTTPLTGCGRARRDASYAEHRERLGAAPAAGDSHFGRHDLGRLLTAFPGRTAADLRTAIAACTTSPIRGITPPPPP